MYSSDDLLKFLKKAALEAVNASKPANVVFGKVISANPLKIQVDQKMILTSMQLVLSKNVTDHTVPVEITWTTESASDHTHSITGTKNITVKNALKLNDEVILMQVSGGQKFIVIDKIG